MYGLLCNRLSEPSENTITTKMYYMKTKRSLDCEGELLMISASHPSYAKEGCVPLLSLH